MQAEIICIGDELLIGQTINTNTAWLGERLNAMGIKVHRSVTIADNEEEITASLNESGSRSSVVILTGGLGPTRDDITKNTLCAYFNTKLAINEEASQRITQFFTERGLPLLEANLQQAALPEACTVIHNYRGTACGMWFERNNVVYVSMPGVPYEMQAMMENEVFEKLRSRFDRPSIMHRTILTTGIGESNLAKIIEDWENSLSAVGIALAYLPSPGAVKLRMSTYSGITEQQTMALSEKEAELKLLISDYIFGYEKETLQGIIGNLLMEKGTSLSIAESCTGGNIAHLVTTVPGSSAYFVAGLICYVNAIKEQELEISPSMISQYNVVSSEVAEAMAIAVRKKFNTGFGLSTTGIAGPSGATEDIPVGSIWVAVANSRGVKSQFFRFGKNRELNIHMASNAALNMLRKEILADRD